MNDQPNEGISQQLRRNVDELGETLGEAIRHVQGDDVYEEVERLRKACIEAARMDQGDELLDQVVSSVSELEVDEMASVVRAFTTYFRLVNEAEKLEIERVNRERSMTGEAHRPDSMAAAIRGLHDEGFGYDEVCSVLDGLDIQPTLTAHPTEARRRTTVEFERALGQILGEWMRPGTTLRERTDSKRRIRTLVRMLLSTDELPPQRRSVHDEVRFGLYFMESSIWDAVPRIHRDIRDAMRDRFGQVPDLHGFLHHRTWIGGDRDGNPNVTPEVTRWTFDEQRRLALRLHRETLWSLRDELSASERIAEIPSRLRESIETDQERNPLPDDLRERYRNEPFRTKLALMIRKIDALSDGEGDYTAEAFCDELELVWSCAVEAFGEPFEEGPLRDALVRARTFGFHLSTVDFRQHSAVHAAAVDEILRAAGHIDGYADLDEAERQRTLSECLTSDDLFEVEPSELSDESAKLLETFDVLSEALARDPNAARSWVVSMTHAPSAMLDVIFLARHAGIWSWNDGDVECPIDVVPLVETVDDLRGADDFLEDLFANEIYRAHLAARDDFQEVMLGYSDSNKDGGYWAANAALWDAQKRIALACEKHGLSHRLFHGRGGTVGRGGGRANKAIFALPPATRNGRIRFTEQGEVISFRYANEALAHRHLEQVTSATLLTSARPAANEPPAGAEELLARLGETSRQAYRDLIDGDDFWQWYRAATPIEQISKLPIASRPVSRSRGDLQFEDLRAIPWNFAWTQTRYCVPGWFGLQVVSSGDHELDVGSFADLYRDWDFFRTLVENSELEMARARFSTARRYDALSEVAMHGRLAEAFGQSRDTLLQVKVADILLSHDAVIRESIELRNPYTDVLNLLQIELLRRIRMADDRERLSEVVLLSLSGVAAAMQSTG